MKRREVICENTDESWACKSKRNKRKTKAMWSDEGELLEIESRLVIPEVRVGEQGDAGRGGQSTSYQRLSPGALCSVVTRGHNTELYPWKSPGEWIWTVVPTTTKGSRWEVKGVSTNLTAVIILQYTRTSRHHVITSDAWNWHNVVCTLQLSRLGAEALNMALPWIRPWSINLDQGFSTWAQSPFEAK